MLQSDGPYLNYAVICEKVLREADGVVSLIRIIDQVTVTIPAPPAAVNETSIAPTPLAPAVPVTFVVGLKSGEYEGSVPVKVRVETPSGFAWPDFETSLLLEGDRGAVIVLPMQFLVQDEGVHWL